MFSCLTGLEDPQRCWLEGAEQKSKFGKLSPGVQNWCTVAILRNRWLVYLSGVGKIANDACVAQFSAQAK